MASPTDSDNPLFQHNSSVLSSQSPRRSRCVSVAIVLISCAAVGVVVLLSQTLEDQSAETQVLVSSWSSALGNFTNALAGTPTACEQLSTAHPFYNTVTSLRSTIVTRASQLGNVSCSDYKANPNAHNGKQVLLYNSCLKNGTFRVITGAHVQLQEDISFNPQSHADWRRNISDPEYAGAAFRLDFFAAITIEAANVFLDLNGHTLEQHRAHRLQQRFYANVELASAPFITSQGPAQFSTAPIAVATRCVVADGKIGRSSHHGIHGNGNRDVLVENVEFEDYEVAAIALNGAARVVVRQVNAAGTATDVPVLGTYSNWRFLSPFVQNALRLSNGASPEKEAALRNASTVLGELAGQVYSDVIESGLQTVNRSAHPDAAALFANEAGLVDGNVYGLAFHTQGAAVDGFRHADDDTGRGTSYDIVVHDTTVTATKASVHEVIALRNRQTGVVQKGPAGDILRIAEIVNITTGEYTGHALANAQIALAALVETLPATLRRQFGTLGIDAAIAAWSGSGNATLSSLVENGTYEFLRNGDTMFHVNKGVIGIRLDGLQRARICQVTVNGVANTGAAGDTRVLPGENSTSAVLYQGASDGGHPNQGRQSGYMGADTRGISLAACSDAHIARSAVMDVSSAEGWAHGVDWFNGSERGKLVHTRIANVRTLSAWRSVAGSASALRIPRAVGVHVGAATEVLESHSNVISRISANISDAAFGTLCTA